MGRTCISCEFYGGKIEGKYDNHYQCLHPIYLSLVGGELNYIRHNCVCYVRRKKNALLQEEDRS